MFFVVFKYKNNSVQFYISLRLIEWHVSIASVQLSYFCLLVGKLIIIHDDVITHKHFPQYFPLCPHKEQVTGRFDFFVISLNQLMKNNCVDGELRLIWCQCNDWFVCDFIRKYLFLKSIIPNVYFQHSPGKWYLQVCSSKKRCTQKTKGV